MARSTWAVQKKVGGSWTADGTLYRPNDSLSIVKRATQAKISLADGSNAYVSPSTVYLDEPLTFVWMWDDGTTRTKIEGYINNQNDVKITDHNANTYIGRFIQLEVVQVVGQNPDKYDLKAGFEIMPALA